MGVKKKVLRSKKFKVPTVEHSDSFSKWAWELIVDSQFQVFVSKARVLLKQDLDADEYLYCLKLIQNARESALSSVPSTNTENLVDKALTFFDSVEKRLQSRSSDDMTIKIDYAYTPTDLVEGSAVVSREAFSVFKDPVIELELPSHTLTLSIDPQTAVDCLCHSERTPALLDGNWFSCDPVNALRSCRYHRLSTIFIIKAVELDSGYENSENPKLFHQYFLELLHKSIRSLDPKPDELSAQKLSYRKSVLFKYSFASTLSEAVRLLAESHVSAWHDNKPLDGIIDSTEDGLIILRPTISSHSLPTKVRVSCDSIISIQPANSKAFESLKRSVYSVFSSASRGESQSVVIQKAKEAVAKSLENEDLLKRILSASSKNLGKDSANPLSEIDYYKRLSIPEKIFVIKQGIDALPC